MKKLKPHHVFSVLDKHFVYNITDNCYREVPARYLRALNYADSDYASFVESSINDADSSSLEVHQMIKELHLEISAEKNNFCLENIATKSKVQVEGVFLLVSQVCNMACRYCGDDGVYSYKNGGFMEESTAYRAVDWMVNNAKTGSTVLTFFGGEALLNFSLMKKIVQYIKSNYTDKGAHEFSYSVGTNGSLMSDEVMDFLADNKVMVSFSFDGSYKVQNYNRPLLNGADSYTQIYENGQKMRERGINVYGCRGTLYADGNFQEDARDIYEELFAFDFPKVRLVPAAKFSAVAGNIKEKLYENLWQADVYCLNKFVAALKSRDAVKTRKYLSNSNITGILAYIENDYWKQVGVLRYKKFCGSGRFKVAVDMKGDIYTCYQFVGIPEHCLGNIYEDNIISLDEESIMTKERECGKCHALHFCAGECYYIFAEKKQCEHIKKLSEYAVYLAQQITEDDVDALVEWGIYKRLDSPLAF